MFFNYKLNIFCKKVNPVFIQNLLKIVDSELNSCRFTHKKNYDKIVKLRPIDVHYRYDDNQFLSGPNWKNEPYLTLTNDEIIELNKLKFEKDIQPKIEVDPNKEPFSQIFQGKPDQGQFTICETVKDDDGSIWQWIERLKPKQILGGLREESELIPNISNSSKLSYYVERTRSRLYPIYRVYRIIGRDHKKYWQNRWDHMYNKYNTHILEILDQIKWENNEKTITVTVIKRIKGDIWKFEEDVRQYLKKHYQLQHLLTSVDEVSGIVELKGDFLDGVVQFFRKQCL